MFIIYFNKFKSPLKKITRSFIVKKLRSRGVPGLIKGYVNIRKLPTFKNKIAYGKSNFPWSLNKNYKKFTNIMIKKYLKIYMTIIFLR